MDITPIKEFGLENNVPIIKDEGLQFLLSVIAKYNVKSVLEIGSAIGYSALCMSEYVERITTIERNKEMHEICISNLNKYDKEKKIESVFMDALEYTPTKTYDLIFIDAAKAQNTKFFLRFTPFLNKNGLVVVDNLNFHGLTDNIENIKSKNLKAMVRKINDFKLWLKENNDFDTIFTDNGDGMSLSIKK